MSLRGKHVLTPHCGGAGLLTDLVVQIKRLGISPRCSSEPCCHFSAALIASNLTSGQVLELSTSSQASVPMSTL